MSNLRIFNKIFVDVHCIVYSHEKNNLKNKTTLIFKLIRRTLTFYRQDFKQLFSIYNTYSCRLVICGYNFRNICKKSKRIS